jgi:hypothetical protein
VIGGTEVCGAPIWGVDVSKFNPLSDVPEETEFVIVRMSYHRTPDPLAADHVRQARERGQVVGAYGFPILTNEIDPQLDLFLEQCRVCGIGAGDMVPFADVEAYPVSSARDALREPLDIDPRELRAMNSNVLCPSFRSGVAASSRYTLVQPTPAWCKGLERWCAGVEREFGAAGIYWTQTTWSQMGKPTGFASRRQWVAHWKTEPGKPACPYGFCDLWQYRVGQWSPGKPHVIGQHDDPHAIDHDRCDGELPLIRLPTPPATPTEPDTLGSMAKDLATVKALVERHGELLGEIKALLERQDNRVLELNERLRRAAEAICPGGNGSLSP